MSTDRPMLANPTDSQLRALYFSLGLDNGVHPGLISQAEVEKKLGVRRHKHDYSCIFVMPRVLRKLRQAKNERT